MKEPDRDGAGRGRGDRRPDIIQAALRCFSHKGYNKTTMDDIVAESGLSKGTLYWYFDSKEALFQAALLSVFEGVGEDLLSSLSRCETPTEKLRSLGQDAAGLGDPAKGYFTLFLEFWVSRPHRDEASKVWYDLLERYKSALTAVIEAGVEAGEFRTVDTESLVWALMATYDGLAAYAAFVPGLDLERISQTVSDVVLNGLKTATSGKRPSATDCEGDGASSRA